MEGEHIGPFNLGNPGEFTMLELAEVWPYKEHVFSFPKHIFFGINILQSCRL